MNHLDELLWDRVYQSGVKRGLKTEQAIRFANMAVERERKKMAFAKRRRTEEQMGALVELLRKA